MAKLPYVDKGDVGPEVRAALDAIPDLNLFRMAAHAETAFIPWLRLGGALLGSLSLDGIHRELAILQVANLIGAEYEWVQHVAIGREVGVTDEQIEAIASGDLDSAAFDETERALLRFTKRAIARDTGDAFDELSAHFEPRKIVELLMVIGHYASIAYLIEATGVELDKPAGWPITDEATAAIEEGS